MLSLARLQRKLRLVESPYRTPQTLVGGPRLDAALMAASGRTATTKAMGKGSTQHQHLVQTEVPPKVLEDWLQIWAEQNGLPTGWNGEVASGGCGLGLPGAQHLECCEGEGRQRHLRRRSRSSRTQAAIDPRHEHLRQLAAQEATDDAGAPFPAFTATRPRWFTI